MKHQHLKPAVCEHDLRHCKDCNVVFCEKCPEEWSQGAGSITINSQPAPWIPYSPQVPYWGGQPAGEVVLCGAAGHTNGKLH